ncbi:MAG: class I SAM-dependent methyltransferase [Prevotella sp.]|jgi:cyclopropane fatty-acyl-phospholipid synthase-like methyltransferase|nr:class I SAM-dependent methyltransferase [Prevotella sp.]
MENKQAIEYWRTMASANPNEKTTKVNPVNDYSQIDADFILEYAGKDSDILDLASGTGLTINKFYDKVHHIDAVELFPDFSGFIKDSANITVINQDVMQFETDRKYDIISMFGIVSYFNRKESVDLYRKYSGLLKPGGKLIVKNQFGITEDVEISGFSEELQQNYFSQYRHLDKEIKILEETGYRNVEAFDIYPPECNRWENTHFYAIVAEK